MTFFQELSLASFAFTSWMKRLQRAVRSGRVDELMEVLEDERSSEIGRWLESCRQSVRLRQSRMLRTVEELYAEIHRLGRELIDFMKDGRQREALEFIGIHGSLRMVSRRFLKALLFWRRHTHHVPVHHPVQKSVHGVM